MQIQIHSEYVFLFVIYNIFHWCFVCFDLQYFYVKNISMRVCVMFYSNRISCWYFCCCCCILTDHVTYFDAFTSMHDNRWEGEKEEDKEKEDKAKKEKPKKKKKEEDKVVESKTPTTQKVGSKTNADNFSFLLTCCSKSWTGRTMIKSFRAQY